MTFSDMQVAVLQHTLGTPTPVRRVPLEGDIVEAASEAATDFPSFKFSDSEQQKPVGQQAISSSTERAPAAKARASHRPPPSPSAASQKGQIGAKLPSKKSGAADKTSAPVQPKAAAEQPALKRSETEKGLLQEMHEVLRLAWQVSAAFTCICPGFI